MPSLSLVIPCYNEEKLLAKTLRQVVSYLKKRNTAGKLLWLMTEVKIKLQ